jgi:hypothetical protein
MQLSLVQNIDDVEGYPDLILFPEGVSGSEIARANIVFPKAVVVSAVAEGEHCIGSIYSGGVKRVTYRKIGTDGNTIGVGLEPEHTPTWSTDDAAIGIIVCMDVQTGLLQRVVATLRRSSKPLKLLCIPADMGAEWFSSPDLGPTFKDIWVALCNLARTDGSTRCDTFIANPNGQKICSKKDGTSLHFTL